MYFEKTLIAAGISAALLAVACGAAVAKPVQEDDSVYRWGRWAVLAPAAGGEEALFAPAGPSNLDRCQSAANCPGPIAEKDPDPVPPNDPPPVDPPIDPPPVDPPIDPPPVDPPIDPPPVDPPKDPEAGRPVGFARIDYRVRGSAQVYDRYVGGIILNNDGTGGQPTLIDGAPDQTVAFEVSGQSAPDGESVKLVSGPVRVNVGTDRFRFNDRGNLAYIEGSYIRGEDGEPKLIEGPWRQTSSDGAFNHSGEYVWGITATQAELTALMDQLAGGMGADLIAHYSGATATGGGIVLDVNFSDSSWTGAVQGTVISFTAGGTLEGARFGTDPALFSDNVRAGKLEGALVNAGYNAIGSFDVKDHNGLREADVFNARFEAGVPR